MTSPDRPLIAVILVAALCVYALVALGLRQWWISGAAAPVVAALLWWRHPRARFAAYVFFSVVALRGAVTGAWAVTAFAVAAVLLMQMPGALRAWPRLRPGSTRAGGDRMPG